MVFPHEPNSHSRCCMTHSGRHRRHPVNFLLHLGKYSDLHYICFSGGSCILHVPTLFIRFIDAVLTFWCPHDAAQHE
ncbi:unnamed protein product, partial [Pylaiella littoralis]